MNCTPQIPSAAGFAPGWMVQGGNCFGRVRTEGHLPERARSIVSLEAARRVDIWEGARREGIRTKPSRLRDSRYFGWIIVFVLFALRDLRAVGDVLFYGLLDI